MERQAMRYQKNGQWFGRVRHYVELDQRYEGWLSAACGTVSGPVAGWHEAPLAVMCLHCVRRCGAPAGIGV